MKSLGYKIQYKGNTRRYLVNDRWVSRGNVPEYRKAQKEVDYKYLNSERGKIMEVITGIFGRPYSNNNRVKWIPELEKKDVWLIVMNHIARMKEKFPGSNGRLCFFCKKPWTYIRRPSNGTGVKQQVINTNFSMDRLDCEQTYKKGNIVCCCFACNDRKGSSTPKDWRVYIEAEKELKRINEME